MEDLWLQLRGFVSELRRRRVFRVTVAYAAVAFLILQVADLLLPAFPLPSWTYTLVVVLLFLGFPITLVLAWAFDIDSTGLHRTRAEVSEPEAEPDGVATRPGTGPRWAFPAAILVIAAIALATYLHLDDGSQTTEPSLGSIAVLPFVDLSPRGDQEYFSDGVAEEIRNSLSRLPGLQVAARSSSFRFKDRAVDVREIGRILDVGAVLEGSVRKSGETLKISAQLIGSEDGYQIWSETYERELADIFAIQEEIAAQVVARIRGEVTAVDSSVLADRPTESTTAYDHYLQGNYQLAKRSPAAVRRAIEAYTAATDADPEFLAPRARIAYAYGLFADWGWPYPGASADDLIEKGLSLTEEVLRRDPRSADAWLARSYLLTLRDPVGLAGALDGFERAIALDPTSAEAHHQYGQSLMVLGCFEEAAAAYRRTLAIEPRRAMTLVPLSALALKEGRLEEAMRLADSAVAVDSSVAYAHAYLATLALELGEVERSLAAAERAVHLDSGYQIPGRAARARARARAGDTVAARAELARAVESLDAGRTPSPTGARYIASAMVELGEKEEAIRLLERVRPRGAWLWFYFLSPEFDPIRSDARFRRVVEDSRPSGLVGQRCGAGSMAGSERS